MLLLVVFLVTIAWAQTSTDQISVTTVTATTETVFYSTIYNTVTITLFETISSPLASPSSTLPPLNTTTAPLPPGSSTVSIYTNSNLFQSVTTTYTVSAANYTYVTTDVYVPYLGAASSNLEASIFWKFILAGVTLLFGV